MIYRSSAGSGKTYALVRNYIKLALLGDEHGFRVDYFRHILAITFTNKAASEMKKRVLSFLEELKNGKGVGEENSFFSHIQEDTSLSAAEVQKRSDQLFTQVLHQYADLSIFTVDKFVYRIVRTFAHDLRLSQNFEVEMDSRKLIQPVVGLLINKVGINTKLSKALVSFALSKTEEGKSYNLEYDLEEFAKQLFVEENQVYINALKEVGIEDCLAVKNELQQKIDSFEQELLRHVLAFETFIAQHSLSPKSFFGGYFYTYMSNLKLFDPDKFKPNNTLRKNMDEDVWFAKYVPSVEQEVIKQHKGFLRGLYDAVQAHLAQYLKSYQFHKLVSRNIYSIAVLNELLQEMEEFKQEQNVKHISEFNQAISDIVRKEHTPFVYERLGERYKHFLIDEFQDTSTMQWHNLLPLVHHALSMGHQNLIVGDAKQSIYRWRGGEVEQFVELPEKIFKGELLPNQKELELSIQRNHQELKLDRNWRSARKIVQFNNNLFASLKETLSPSLQTIYKAHKQFSQNQEEGYVQIDFTDKSDDTKHDIMQKVVLKLQQLREQGHTFKSMAVLCRTRKDASIVAYYLSQAQPKITVVSDEALLLNASKEVNLLVALLRLMAHPICKVSMAFIINYFLHKNLINSNIHSLLKVLDEDEYVTHFHQLMAIYGYDLKQEGLWKLPLYDVVEKLIQLYKLPIQNSYLQFFLDVVLKFSIKQGNDVADFVEWWEENNEKEAIVLPDDMDAVKIMTVHKSKGLEFPIVFIPFQWEIGNGSKELWVDAKGELSQMKVALISNSKKLEDTHYAQERQLEQEKAYLDDVNVLYVALTRASEQLYVYTQTPAGQGKMNTLGKLFQHYFTQQQQEVPYSIGVVPPPKKKLKKSEFDSFVLDYQRIPNWRAVVQLKNNAKQLWDVEQSKQEWGTLLHQAMANIHHIEDGDKVLKDLQFNGLIDKVQAQQLTARINELLADPEITPFFEEKWQVLTEREILSPTGDAYVPDRVLIGEDEVQIVDYKTGSKTKEQDHRKQINQYAGLLQQMGYTNIKKFIIYTEEPEKVMQV